MPPKEIETKEKMNIVLQEIVMYDGTSYVRVEPDIAETLSKKDLIDLINQLKKELSYRD